VQLDGVSYQIVSDWYLGDPLFTATINGRHLTVQIERKGSGYQLFYRGATVDALVLSPRAAELSRHMLEKVPPDLSKFLLSPMPGLLVKLNVAVGDKVEEGQELAVIEAMKMENSLRALNAGVVAKVAAAAGDSLTVDQIIVEFE
jgi:propionyl-CoA carboxylase alpha chain